MNVWKIFTMAAAVMALVVSVGLVFGFYNYEQRTDRELAAIQRQLGPANAELLVQQACLSRTEPRARWCPGRR